MASQESYLGYVASQNGDDGGSGDVLRASGEAAIVEMGPERFVGGGWVVRDGDVVSTSEPVVSADWLHVNIRGPDVKVARIPGALFFDVVGISDRASNLPHLLSKEEAFAATVSALGIQNKDGLVVYDGKGIFSAARVWWMFRAFRHERVWVLDGGLPQWRATRFDVESGASGDPILNASVVSEVVEKVYKGQAVAPIPFQTKYQPHLVWTLEQCLAVLFFVGGFCVRDLYSESDDKTWV
ncbi:hypothetical protein IFM89_036668 [Coptis chinensis]|uniref:Rhodanese domain-containing protein n=1 Tax=Coptis chinensis TaxID=261450 RepID=A0A835I3D7_9MAGN|nr:hypothetical protein IFM89_036668 [Coptis chinensis]